jgi:hypothetical protein
MTNPIPQRDINKMVLQLCNDDPEKLKEIHLMIRSKIHLSYDVESRKAYFRKYYAENREMVREKSKKWYTENKSKKLKVNKECQRRFRDNNVEKMKAKVTCEVCNCEIVFSGLTMHRRTKKHMKHLEKQTLPSPEQDDEQNQE